MQQRLKLSLTLHSDSDILLLDEPCSNLDERWMDWYNDRLGKIGSEKITIISSNNHREELKLLNTDPIDLTTASYH
jgi:ABC-type multidrug transport system ATPase subunit